MKDILNLFSGVNIPSSNILHKAFKILFEKYLPKEIEVTYDQLKKLRDDNQLITGMKYRLIDYNGGVSPNGVNNQIRASLNNRFDIVLTALTENQLEINCTFKPHIYKNVYGYNIKLEDIKNNIYRIDEIDASTDYLVDERLNYLTYIKKDQIYIPVILSRQGSLLDATFYIRQEVIDGVKYDVWYRPWNYPLSQCDDFAYDINYKTTLNVTGDGYDRLISKLTANGFQRMYTKSVGNYKCFSFEDITYNNLYKYSGKYTLESKNELGEICELDKLYVLNVSLSHQGGELFYIKTYIDIIDGKYCLNPYGHDPFPLRGFDPSTHTFEDVYNTICQMGEAVFIYRGDPGTMRLNSYDISYLHGSILELTDDFNNTFSYDFKNKIWKYLDDDSIASTETAHASLAKYGNFNIRKDINSDPDIYDDGKIFWYHTFMYCDHNSNLMYHLIGYYENIKCLNCYDISCIQTDSDPHKSFNIEINIIDVEGEYYILPKRPSIFIFHCCCDIKCNMSNVTQSLLLYSVKHLTINPCGVEHLEFIGCWGEAVTTCLDDSFYIAGIHRMLNDTDPIVSPYNYVSAIVSTELTEFADY